MTNFEKHLDECMEFLAERLAFNVKTQKLIDCCDCKCDECIFKSCCTQDINLNDKINTIKEWFKTEYVEPQVDWSKVAVDTPILVSNYLNVEEWKWQKRYFAKYENGKIYAFGDGATSWSANMSVDWQYAKLYDEGVDA